MGFSTIEKKGIPRFLIDESIPPERLSMHRSLLSAGSRSHDPHTHEGTEGFYILSGTAIIESGNDVIVLATGESIVVDCATPHAIRNNAAVNLEYLVVNTR
ncbi:MAG: cupin domain-containing protein [Spirochaetales bacterium]|nr:MAG: cupin domain-containing protein [Spirochaetales bacterium]